MRAKSTNMDETATAERKMRVLHCGEGGGDEWWAWVGSRGSSRSEAEICVMSDPGLTERKLKWRPRKNADGRAVDLLVKCGLGERERSSIRIIVYWTTGQGI